MRRVSGRQKGFVPSNFLFIARPEVLSLPNNPLRVFRNSFDVFAGPGAVFTNDLADRS